MLYLVGLQERSLELRSELHRGTRRLISLDWCLCTGRDSLSPAVSFICKARRGCDLSHTHALSIGCLSGDRQRLRLAENAEIEQAINAAFSEGREYPLRQLDWLATHQVCAA